jgi:glycine oxidase
LSKSLKKPDIVIHGAGVVGLSLALELASRGRQVFVLERDKALSQASAAAAGMLAVRDPFNPPALGPLSRLSGELYAMFLERIEALSGVSVPFQTRRTQQSLANGGVETMEERSIDPRQLGAALRVAIKRTSIVLHEHSIGPAPEAAARVYTTGAWFPWARPAKGQMLRVQLPADFPLREVHRAEDVYIVPRTCGPQAGTALIGATVEDVGFDTATHPHDLAKLQARAAELLPQLAEAPIVEAWAGLRPDTPDHLPLIGRLGSSNEFVATGHFRNGILLAPATAAVLADLLEGKAVEVDLEAFAPGRFGSALP